MKLINETYERPLEDDTNLMLSKKLKLFDNYIKEEPENY